MTSILVPGLHRLMPDEADADQGQPPAEAGEELVLLQPGLVKTQEAVAELSRQMGQDREGFSAPPSALSALEVQGHFSQLDSGSSQQLAELNALRSGVEDNSSRIGALEASFSQLRSNLGVRWERQEMQAASMLEEHLAQTDALDLLVRSQDQHKQEVAEMRVRLEAVEQHVGVAGSFEPTQHTVCSHTLEPAVEAMQTRLDAIAVGMTEQLKRLERIQGAHVKEEPPQGHGHLLATSYLLESARGSAVGTRGRQADEGDSEDLAAECGGPLQVSLMRDLPTRIGSTPEQGNATQEPSGDPEAELVDLGAWLARRAGELEVGLRVELSSRLHKHSGELRSQVLAEVASAEARSDAVLAGLRADFQRMADDLRARFEALRAATLPSGLSSGPAYCSVVQSQQLRDDSKPASAGPSASAEMSRTSRSMPPHKEASVALPPHSAAKPGVVERRSPSPVGCSVTVLCADETLPSTEDACGLPQRSGTRAGGARSTSPAVCTRRIKSSLAIGRPQGFEQAQSPPPVQAPMAQGPAAAPTVTFSTDGTSHAPTAPAWVAVQLGCTASVEALACSLVPAPHKLDSVRDGIQQAGYGHLQQQQHQHQAQQLQRQQQRRQQQEQQRQQQHRYGPPIIVQTPHSPLRKPSL
uniref:Uncharacterized protein n=1 Tax=Pyrodinium bahamense TaxID=73915 RepID=A0A7S0ATR5_9DINO|mmetsp:Transcript_41597/g.115770  ORF Transcript_41597/g.115770 Transcript_41597/m.115770 type:complete len:641 (+) Transcript_41597:128-2050(+)